MKALIKVGYGCNENCSFCHTLHVRHVDGSAEEVHRKIERAKALGHSMVVLSGGEPTIRPELMEWAEHVQRMGMKLGLVTNGLVLSYPEVVEKLIARGLEYVYLSLHGGEARMHDGLVRTRGAFDQAVGALRNLSGRGLDLTVNCVVTRQNVEHLRAVVDLVLPFRDATLKLSMVEPKGGGDALFEHLMPRVAEVAERVRDAIAYGMERATPDGPRFSHGAIPLCLLPGIEHLYSDLRTHAFRTMIEIGEPDFFPVDDLNKVQPEETCRGCALRGPCPGLYRGYHEHHGAGELRPVRDRARGNSFHWVLDGVLPPSKNGECQLLEDGITPWDRARYLFVAHQGKVARYLTHTRDFADVEIDRIKHALGQAYVDVSKKDAPDDFPRDLVPLRRASRCAPCPERDRCTGLFEPVMEDLFSRDDEALRAVVAGLEGDVLDVGCGDGPYERELAARAASGAIRYTGIDPDPARIESLRARRPWAALRTAAAEDLEDVARYDHILVLRSWNHLRDPSRALAALLRAARPGASLTIADNVAFGLVRTPAQARRAEQSRSVFEHFRNDDASDAERAVRAAGLRVLERREVGPGTSNQWVIRAVYSTDPL